MKRTLSSILTLFILSFAFPINAQQAISGIWNMGQDNTKIEITEKNESYEGRIFSSDNTKARIGNLFLKDVKSVDGKWKGKLYSPKKNEWFDAILALEGNQLLVTVGSGFLEQNVEVVKGVIMEKGF